MKRTLNKTMRSLQTAIAAAAVSIVLAGCTAGGDNPGLEYAPNMYHSVAYEPLSQITDTTSGAWVNALDNPSVSGEFFNSNFFNGKSSFDRKSPLSNMREPAPNTVKRNAQGWLPYRIGRVAKDSIDIVVAGMKNPLDSTKAIVSEGKVLYEYYCQHCHGKTGAAESKIATTYPLGVANLTAADYSEPHIFQVITHGAGNMGAHGSQVSPEDRWKIAKYVRTLRKK
jgi:mono/diheme cytochrome c family protein